MFGKVLLYEDIILYEDDDMDTTSAISEDDEYRDFSDPEVCIDLFRRMRGTSLKVNYET